LKIFKNNFNVRLGCSLSADPNITDLLQGKHPKIFAGIGEVSKEEKYKSLISLKRGKIQDRTKVTIEDQ